MTDSSIVGFGFSSAAAIMPPISVPTKALVAFITGGATADGWGEGKIILMGLDLNTTMIEVGDTGGLYTSIIHDDFRFYFMNISATYSGILRYNLQVTLTGEISSNICRFVLGKATAVQSNDSYNFVLTDGATTHALDPAAGKAAYLNGTIPYNAATNDILIFGLRNESKIKPINLRDVRISGILTLESTLT